MNSPSMPRVVFVFWMLFQIRSSFEALFVAYVEQPPLAVVATAEA